MICVICNLFDLICGVGILLKDRGGGGKILFLEEQKGGQQTDIQTDGRNCSLLKLTSVYTGKLENSIVSSLAVGYRQSLPVRPFSSRDCLIG